MRRCILELLTYIRSLATIKHYTRINAEQLKGTDNTDNRDNRDNTIKDEAHNLYHCRLNK